MNVDLKTLKKQEIKHMVDEIENLKFLDFLYDMIISFKKKWGI